MLGKKPTKAQERRFLEVQDRGCVPCYVEARIMRRDWTPEPCDIHHTNGADDHDRTYGNCPWHHRGVSKFDLSDDNMHSIFGPSLALDPAEYRSRYGTEAELLALQNTMLLKSVGQLHGEI